MVDMDDRQSRILPREGSRLLSSQSEPEGQPNDARATRPNARKRIENTPAPAYRTG
jgi:hypothetical protein